MKAGSPPSPRNVRVSIAFVSGCSGKRKSVPAVLSAQPPFLLRCDVCLRQRQPYSESEKVYRFGLSSPSNVDHHDSPHFGTQGPSSPNDTEILFCRPRITSLWHSVAFLPCV